MIGTDTVEALLGLQEVDGEIARGRRALLELEPGLEEVRERLEEIGDRLERTRAALEEAEGGHRSDRRSVEAGRETLKRLQERADRVDDMRQHRAVQAELATARRNLETSEREALESLQRVERHRTRLEELEREMASAREELDHLSRTTGERRERIERELRVQRERRSRFEEALEEEVLELYEQVRRGRTQEALAPLDGAHCGHCFTMIPPQKRNEIRSGRRLLRCEGCGVILHPPLDGGD